MIRAKIFLPGIDWTIYAYIAVHEYYTYEILDRMRQIGASPHQLQMAHANLISGQLNNGLTVSNPDTRKTVWVTCLTTSAREFFNTIVHEIGHVGQHVGMQLGLDPYGEDVCYLQGDIAFELFPYCRELLCEHCRKENDGMREIINKVYKKSSCPQQQS